LTPAALRQRPGQGNLFGVYLPALEGTVAEGSSVKAPAPALVEMRGSETILIADDHESIREMARQALMNLGYRVLSACDGEKALRLCEKETPALAILDIIMPKLGGPAVASRLTTLFSGLPILFTGGYSQDSENVLSATPDAHHLQKPYSPTTLGRVVREILDQVKKRKHRAEPRAQNGTELTTPAFAILREAEEAVLFPGICPFFTLTGAFRGATNRRKTSSLVVSLLTNCRAQCASEAAVLPGRAGLLSR
jgi:CheY-like chemotaxis protein